MRILFMGTPEFARTALFAIREAYPNEIVGVITRQDTPKNRGHAMTPPPVKTAALEMGIPVYQPVNLKEENFRDILLDMNPDIIVVVAYGRILPVTFEHMVITQSFVLSDKVFSKFEITSSSFPRASKIL